MVPSFPGSLCSFLKVSGVQLKFPAPGVLSLETTTPNKLGIRASATRQDRISSRHQQCRRRGREQKKKKCQSTATGTDDITVGAGRAGRQLAGYA